MIYIVYLDEFGHIGPYVSPTDDKHRTHPAFGLAGIALPANHVRSFASFFFNMKNTLLDFEIKASGKHPATWEKKGSSLYTRTNVAKYPELRRATYRLFNKLKSLEGFVIYVGIEKHKTPEDSNAKGLYKQVMHEMIKRLDEEFIYRQSKFMMMVDQQDDMQKTGQSVGMRSEIVRSASMSMFGKEARRTLIEPPVQAESHLYQTLQCADWICGLVGRLVRYRIEPNAVPTHDIFAKYFGERLKQIARRSSIRKRPQVLASDVLSDE